MEGFRGVAKLKIQAACDRTDALASELSRIDNRRVYSSPGCKTLIQFIRDAASRIRILLDDENSVADGGLLSSEELESRLHRATRLLPLLHRLIGFLEGSEVNQSPGQLIQPLRRYVRTILPNAEIIVSVKPELNYSIREIAGPLRQVFGENPSLAESCTALPEFLFAISIPVVESEQILIHAILAHELGHPLYDRAGLGERLLPQIQVRQDLVQSLATAISQSQQEDLRSATELYMRQWVTEKVTDRVTQWAVELSADAIGIRLFGPALYFAEIHLITSFSHLDFFSETHPAPRLRLKLMAKLLKQLYDVRQWDTSLQQFVTAWDEVAAVPLSARDGVNQIALESINTDTVLQTIIDLTETTVPASVRYSPETFLSDVKKLTPLFIHLIPPGELLSGEGWQPVALPAIINAGWFVYLCKMQEFTEQLHTSDRVSRLASVRKLQALLFKALEIAEIRTAWSEIKRDLEHRSDTGTLA